MKQVHVAYYANFCHGSNISQGEIMEKYLRAMMHTAIRKILVSSHSIICLILDLCQSNSLTTFPEELFFPLTLWSWRQLLEKKKKTNLSTLPNESSGRQQKKKNPTLLMDFRVLVVGFPERKEW